LSASSGNETYQNSLNLLRKAEPIPPDGWLALRLPWRRVSWVRKNNLTLKRNFQTPTVAQATVGFLFSQTITERIIEMSARFSNTRFEEEDEFDLASGLERQELEERFAGLKDSLLEDRLAQTEIPGLQDRIELAANEAAGIAFTTEFPLLVFPSLLEELARRERARTLRQQRIIAETEALLECAV
jgi:hypothetical protein